MLILEIIQEKQFKLTVTPNIVVEILCQQAKTKAFIILPTDLSLFRKEVSK